MICSLVSIYRAKNSDCTNGGISALEHGCDYLDIFAEGEALPDKPPSPGTARAFLVRGNLPGTAKIVPPNAYGLPATRAMFGGNYAGNYPAPFGEAVSRITGSRNFQPVAIHDRFE